MLEQLSDRGYEIKFVSHAEAILMGDFPAAINELQQVLHDFSISITEIIGSGGGESKGTQRLRRALADLNWRKGNFEIRKIINGVLRESISHEIDHVRQFEGGESVALEIEWNNKDPFFDRDLENFKRLHTEGAISVGIIVTRGSSMQENLWDLVYRFTQEHKIDSFAALERLGLEPTRRQRAAVTKQVERERKQLDFATAWTNHFVNDKFGAATTHWSKLMDRVHRGVGNPCPLLLIGLPSSIVSFDTSASIEVVENDTSAMS